jgi:hypothetical protein
MPPAKHKGLELNEDRVFQEWFWSFERVAWIAMAVFVVAALAGLTGAGGPLAQATAANAQVDIAYPRIARWEASDVLTLTLPAGSGRATTVEIDKSFGKVFQITDIQPAPAQSAATGFGQALEFALDDPPGERTIVLRVRAMKPSLGEAIAVRVNGGPPLVLYPIVLP